MKTSTTIQRLFLAAALLAAMPACSHAQQPARTFHRNQRIDTVFSYEPKLESSTQWYRMMKLATGGEARIDATKEVICKTTLVAMDYKEKEQKDMTVTFQAEYLKDGKPVFTAEVVRDLSGCIVNHVIIDGKYRSEYSYPTGRRELPLIKTTDVKTGKLVSETKNLEIVGDGSFRVDEIHYSDGKESFHTRVRRHAGTGMFVDEAVKQGKLDVDYHHYELLLGNWSMGRM